MPRIPARRQVSARCYPAETAAALKGALYPTTLAPLLQTFRPMGISACLIYGEDQNGESPQNTRVADAQKSIIRRM